MHLSNSFHTGSQHFMPEMLTENSSKFPPPLVFMWNTKMPRTGDQGNWMLELISLLSRGKLACVSSLFQNFHKLKKTESEWTRSLKTISLPPNTHIPNSLKTFRNLNAWGEAGRLFCYVIVVYLFIYWFIYFAFYREHDVIYLHSPPEEPLNSVITEAIQSFKICAFHRP